MQFALGLIFYWKQTNRGRKSLNTEITSECQFSITDELVSLHPPRERIPLDPMFSIDSIFLYLPSPTHFQRRKCQSLCFAYMGWSSTSDI